MTRHTTVTMNNHNTVTKDTSHYCYIEWSQYCYNTTVPFTYGLFDPIRSCVIDDVPREGHTPPSLSDHWYAAYKGFIRVFVSPFSNVVEKYSKGILYKGYDKIKQKGYIYIYNESLFSSALTEKSTKYINDFYKQFYLTL